MEIRRGQDLPAWRLATVGGTSIALRDFLGSPVLFVGWASWDPSRDLLPALEKFHRSKRDVIRVVSIAFDVRGPEYAMKYLAPAGCTHEALVDNCFLLSRAWGVRELPFAVLADAEGRALLAEEPGPGFFPSVLAALKRRTERISAKAKRPSARYPRFEVLLQSSANFLTRARKDDAVAALREAGSIGSSNAMLRRQILAMEHPERFYEGKIDAAWLRSQESVTK